MDRLNELTRETFNVLCQLRQVEGELRPNPEQLHRRLRGLVDGFRQRAAQSGYAAQDVDDMAYAMVALADEIALERPGPLRDHWMSRLLQMHYFNENVAGDNFFVRLEQARGDSRRLDVLRVYYLALLFGFQGRYRIRGGEAELQRITDSVAEGLRRLIGRDVETLSPHGDRPEEARRGARRALPLVWVAAGMLLVSVGVYVAMRASLGGEVDAVVTRIKAAGGEGAR